MAEPVTVALAIGSNIGDRLAALREAIRQLASFIDVTQKSPVYETAAAYVTDQPSFLNAALIGTTTLEPLALLWTLKGVESAVGRLPTFRYGPRVIDIDILFYGDQILATPELTIPHARMAERTFVLRPLADIAGDWQHPQNGKNVATMLVVLADDPISCLGDVL